MAGKSGAIRAGRAFVELFADDSRLVKGLHSAQQRLRAFGAAVTSIGGSLVGLGAGILTPLGAAATAFANIGSQAADMAARTGLSTEAVSELGFAAEQSGADLATLEGGLRKMQRNLGELAEGNKTAADSFAKLGISWSDLQGLSADEQFSLIAQRISEIDDATLQASAAMEIFGKSGTSLLPLMAGGAEGIAALRDEARKLGLSISGEDAAAAEEFGDALDKVWATIKGVTFQIGAALAPTLSAASGLVSGFVGDLITWAKENRGLVQTVALAAGLVVGLGVALLGLGLASTVAAAALGGLAALLGVITSPITLVVAGLAGLVAWLVRSGVASDYLSSTFAPLAGEALSAFGAIKSALVAGDFGAAAQVLWTTLRMWWAKGTGWLMEKWIGLKTGMVDVWREMGASIQRIIVDVMAFVRKSISDVGLTVTQQIAELALETSGMSDGQKAIVRRGLGIAFDSARGANAEQIEADRLGARTEIDAQNAREAAESLERYNAELAASQAGLDEARAQWEAAVNAANGATPAGEGGGTGFPDFSQVDELLEQLEQGAGAARSAATQTQTQIGGTFSSLAAQIFAANRGPQERTAAATEATARNTARLVRDGRGNLRYAT